MTYVTCKLSAKNRDQLRNPTLGNRVWATFTILFTVCAKKISICTLKLDGVFTIAMFPEDENRLGRSEHTTVLNSVAESVAVVPTFV